MAQRGYYFRFEVRRFAIASGRPAPEQATDLIRLGKYRIRPRLGGSSLTEWNPDRYRERRTKPTPAEWIEGGASIRRMALDGKTGVLSKATTMLAAAMAFVALARIS
jgi:hypothetical protein